MVRLAEALLAHRPREASGSSSANRFEFQRTWALCHLLQLHESNQNYVLILEFHDDVLVLDDEVDPQGAEFFQVKTRRDGHWSKRDLLSAARPATKKGARNTGKAGQGESERKPETPRSILGKLLEHCRHFLPQVRSLNVVSNVRFKIPLANLPASTDRERFSMGELREESLREVKEAIRTELEFDEELPWERVYLVASGLSITEHEKYGAGELTEFLDRRRPGGRFAVQPLFRTLCGELSRRATNEWQPVSFGELCQKKGIRRVDLEHFLRVAENQLDPEEQLRSVKLQLMQEGHVYRDVIEIEAGWRRYDIDRIDQADMIVQNFKEQVISIVKEVRSSTSWRTLREFLADARRAFVRRYGQPVAPFSAKYLEGALLHEFKSHEARELPSSDSQPPAGAP